FDFRAPIDIAGAPEEVAVELVFSHADLVDAEKSQADGDDVRVFVDGPDGLVEIDRFLDPASKWDAVDTRIWFKIQPGGGSYFLYYGWADAEDPPADPSNVFLLFEDFAGADYDAGWSYDAIGTNAAATSALTDSGQLAMRGRGSDIGSTADSMVFFHRELDGDFTLDVRIAGESSSGGTAKLGGVMLRESLDPDSRFAGVLLLNAPSGMARTFLNMQRTATGTDATQTTAAAGVEFPYHMRLRRSAGSTFSQYSLDGRTFNDIGGPATLGLVDPVTVGVPYSNASGADGTLLVDFIRARRIVSPEPVPILGEEENL